VKALVTGAAGYVGSHVVVALAEAGHDAVALDDLSRGRAEAVTRAERLAGRAVPFEIGDVCDQPFVERVLREHRPDVVMHIAAYKSVAESVERPDLYERNNVVATRTLAQAMAATGFSRVVYASTGGVYGDADSAQISEDARLAPISPYAATKAEGERALHAQTGFVVGALRFFNVCGAHPSGDLGEYGENSQNLFPVIQRRLRDADPAITVFGTDYPTPDGTCVRDYVHVCDIARGNVLAAERVLGGQGGLWNLGTGRGSSVLDVLHAMERATGREIRAVRGSRRPGDPVACVADVRRARAELGFEARYDLDDMAITAVRWQQRSGAL